MGSAPQRLRELPQRCRAQATMPPAHLLVSLAACAVSFSNSATASVAKRRTPAWRAARASWERRACMLPL